MPLHSTNEWQAPPTGNTGPDGAGTSTVPTQQEDAVTPFKGLALFQCLHFFFVCVCVHSYCTYGFWIWLHHKYFNVYTNFCA